MKRLRKNLSEPRRQSLYQERTHEISKRFCKNHWKSKFKIPEVEKEEELGRKKDNNLKETLTEN